MKRMLVILLFLSGVSLVHAAVIPPEQARRTAEAFLASQPRTKAAPVSLSLSWRMPSTKAGEADLLYAYENSGAGGYVIVSGEDAVGPVLGYAPAGRFPAADMPDGMKWLMRFYGEMVSLARAHAWTTSAGSDVFDPSRIVKLKTAAWGQLYPYNKDTPDIYGNGNNPPAGCVATAIGIIMNYHRWPQRGQGFLPGYTYTMMGDTFTIEGCELGHPYDWDAMNAENPDYDEIARLLHEIGVMTEMLYLGTGSGTTASYVTRLSQYFGYDKGIVHRDRDNYTDERFESFIRDEIDARRPVLFSAYRYEDGGHCMVIDGYCGNYFSINFGWEGKPIVRDGYSNPQDAGVWFLLTPVRGLEKDVAAYHYNQFVMCNIKPDAGGETPLRGSFSNARVTLPYDFSPGKPFKLLGSLFSSLPADACFVLTDASGMVKETISGSFHLDGNDDWIFGWKVFEAECTVHEPIEAGDQILVAMYADGKRIPVENPRESVITFGKQSPPDGLLVGYVTGNTTNPMNGFLEQALRDGRSWNVREYWEDFFYFKCYKDLVWQMIDLKSGHVEWDSGELYDSDTAYGEKPRFTALLQEDYFYNFIRLRQGDYLLRIRNPLTGEDLSIQVTI